ncbi:MAG: RluA family pseudouridine synthase [bacterium]
MTDPTLDTPFQITIRTADRIDRALTEALLDNPFQNRQFSRSTVSGWISDGRVQSGGRVITKPSHAVVPGEVIDIAIPPVTVIELRPEYHDFDVLYEDDAILVINKPVGLRVHPTTSDLTGSLISGVLGRGYNLAPAGGALRPGVVHRLDKTTSGVMVLARTDPAYYALVTAFRERTVRKSYLALTKGIPRSAEGLIDGPIGRDPNDRKRFTITPRGKTASTGYKLEQRYLRSARLRLALHTGRTHQIRVHLQSIGTPVVGDRTYGGGVTWPGIHSLLAGYAGNCLHAAELSFTHPISGAAMQFTAPLPATWIAIEGILRDEAAGTWTPSFGQRP